MRGHLRAVAWASLFLAIIAPAGKAEVRLPKIFSSHAVLQREQPIHVWGWAAPGESVSASLNGTNQSSAADRLGQWNIYLPPAFSGGR